VEKKNYIVAIDLGSSNVVVAVAERDAEGRPVVRSIVSKPSQGVKAGMITNIEQVSNSIKAAVEAVGEELGIRITEAYTGISGDFVRCARHTDHVFTSDPQNGVNRTDVEALFDRMRNVQAPDDETIMERIPQNYLVDENQEVADPVGSFGKRLASTFNFILCAKTPIERLNLALRRLGITIRGRMYDTMILHYLLDPESRHNMNALAEKYLNYKPIEIETLIGKGSKQLTMDLVNVERVKEYAAEDADVTLQLKQALYPMIEQIGLQHLYFEIEEPMIAVLADIEMAGVRIDSEALAVYAVELNRKLAELEAAIRTEAGEPNLNINSARQLGEVLFGKMRIAEKPKMTKTKQFCTDEDYLQLFARKHRIVDLILEYRGVKKLLSTYVEALPQLVNRSTGRIHTSFNQAVTATGRLSSTNPNLQNIPVRDDMGRRIRAADAELHDKKEGRDVCPTM